MENDILDSLEDLGYSGAVLEEGEFQKALDDGPRSQEFTKVVEWLTKEIGGFAGLDEHVNATTGPDDTENFMMELSGFLREYGCPYTKLNDGPISQRLAENQDKLNLLDFLCTELSALRMIAKDKPHLLATVGREQQQQLQQPQTPVESETAKYLKMMLIALGFPKPPEGITPFQLFSKVESKVKELISKAPANYLNKPLLKARLSEKQWANVEQINDALTAEYECRRDMILKRLDVTVQSFKWSDRAKSKENELATAYQDRRRAMSAKPSIGLHHVIAAREDLLEIQKTSSGPARERTKCAINKVMIGKVPDRGGRAYEMEPPPPEMPSFMKRQDAPRGGRGGGDRGGRGSGRGGRGGDRGGRGGDRGGRGGDRGGRGGDRVQSGWSDRPQSGGGGGGWSQGGGSAHFGANYDPGTAFFGGSQGGYQQGGYQQGGYQQGGYQQGGYQQGGYQQGGYQQGSHQQGGYQQGGAGYQQGRGGYDNQGGQRGGRGGGGGGRGGRGGRGRR